MRSRRRTRYFLFVAAIIASQLVCSIYFGAMSRPTVATLPPRTAQFILPLTHAELSRITNNPRAEAVFDPVADSMNIEVEADVRVRDGRTPFISVGRLTLLILATRDVTVYVGGEEATPQLASAILRGHARATGGKGGTASLTSSRHIIPVWSAALPFAIVISATVIGGIALSAARSDRSRRGEASPRDIVCPECGYDLRGLEHSTRSEQIEL